MIRVLHSVSVMDRGGQETFIMNVYRNIDRSQIQFDFLCSSDKKGDYDEEIKALGGKIIYLDIARRGGKFSKYYFERKDIARFLSRITDDYDIIHLHNYHAFTSYIWVTAARKAGFKNIILHSHNSCAPRIKLHNIFRPLLSSVKGITRFACSLDAGKWLHGKKSFDVIYNGIDIEKFRYDTVARENLRQDLGLNDNFVVGMVGRFNYQKNHLFALEVFRKCVYENPNAKLVLVGKGELEQKIRDKIIELNLQDNVILLGTRDDVDKLMSAFDVLFMPSIFEGLGIVLIEAQYCKLPIVASNVLSKEVFISDAIATVSLADNKEIWNKSIMQCAAADRNKIQVKSDLFDIRIVTLDLSEKYARLACDGNEKIMRRGNDT